MDKKMYPCGERLEIFVYEHLVEEAREGNRIVLTAEEVITSEQQGIISREMRDYIFFLIAKHEEIGD